MAKVYRFLEYRKALWFARSYDLETLIRAALRVLPNSRDRVVDRSDGTSDMGARIVHYPGEGVILHCTRYVDGQPAGVVPMADQQIARVSERLPGNQENFLHRDFLGFVRGDHVITFNAANNGASLRSYLQGLFRLAGLDDNAGMFDLVRRASADQIARIAAAGGVERVEMDLSIEEATRQLVVDRAQTRQTWSAKRFLDPIAGIVQDLVRSDEKASDLGRSQKGNMRLSISVPKGDLLPAKEGLDGVAEILVEDEDAADYVIRLRDGNSIKPSEMAIRRRIRIERYANTVDTDDLIQEMRDYMTELHRTGQLEA